MTIEGELAAHGIRRVRTMLHPGDACTGRIEARVLGTGQALPESATDGEITWEPGEPGVLTGATWVLVLTGGDGRERRATVWMLPTADEGAAATEVRAWLRDGDGR